MPLDAITEVTYCHNVKFQFPTTALWRGSALLTMVFILFISGSSNNLMELLNLKQLLKCWYIGWSD